MPTCLHPDATLAVLAASPEHFASARRLAYLLVALLLLAVITMTGFLVLRSLQRSRQRMSRKPAAPTAWVDVWKMHKTPDDTLAEPDDDNE